MGIYHRDYMRPGFEEEPTPPRGPGSWSVVTWLIVINIVVYLLQGSDGLNLERAGSLSGNSLGEGRVWTLVTYMFLHGNALHLAVNMLGLHFLARNVQLMMGKKHFLIIYFGGGILGGAAQTILGVMTHNDVPLVGASAGVYATVFALAALIPQQVVQGLLFFIIPFRARMITLARIIVAADVLMLTMDQLGIWNMGIGNLAHLGGAVVGWLYVKRVVARVSRPKPSSDEEQRWLNRFGGSHVVDAEVAEPSEEKKSWFGFSRKKSYVSESVDQILDKISSEGMQSLTEEERDILEKSSEKLTRMTNRADRED